MAVQKVQLSFLKMLQEIDEKIMAALPPGQHAPCPGCSGKRWKTVEAGFQCRSKECGYIRKT